MSCGLQMDREVSGACCLLGSILVFAAAAMQAKFGSKKISRLYGNANQTFCVESETQGRWGVRWARESKTCVQK